MRNSRQPSPAAVRREGTDRRHAASADQIDARISPRQTQTKPVTPQAAFLVTRKGRPKARAGDFLVHQNSCGRTHGEPRPFRQDNLIRQGLRISYVSVRAHKRSHLARPAHILFQEKSAFRLSMLPCQTCHGDAGGESRHCHPKRAPQWPHPPSASCAVPAKRGATRVPICQTFSPGRRRRHAGCRPEVSVSRTGSALPSMVSPA